MKENASLRKIMADVFSLFSKKEKRQFILLYIFGIGNSVTEILSITAVLPFMYLILDIEKASKYPILRDLYALPFIRSNLIFAVAAAICVVLLFVIKNVYSTVYAYFKGAVMRKIQTKYALRLYQYYLDKPYEFFFSTNTSELHRRVCYVCRALIGVVMSCSMSLFTQLITMTALIIMVIVTGTKSILAASFVLVVVCAALYFAVQNKTKEISRESNRLNKKLYQTIYEYLRGVEDLRVLGRGDCTAPSVEGLFDGVNSLEIKSGLLSQIPGRILEIGTVSVILYILISSYVSYGNINDVLPVISLCGVAIYKLRSVLSGFLSTAVSLRSSTGLYEEAFEDMKASVEYRKAEVSSVPIGFNDKIIIDDIHYTYPGTDREVLSGLSVDIKRGEAIGIMGASGEGKSTLADLFMGLLEPQSGQITIDGVSLKNNESRFRKIVGYVPQNIFMMDESILANVAFGVPVEDVDREKVRKCLATAQLLDFVDSLPDKEDSIIGDNGIRISGGQRQRIGIARALYNDPQILLFDEATSSLDEETERNFIDTVKSMSGEYTILIIAHRKETLKYCNRILHIDEGKIV